MDTVQTALAKEAAKRPTYQRTDELANEIGELADTRVGHALIDALLVAYGVWISKERANNDRRSRRQPQLNYTPEERLAERLLNLIGPAEDCWLIADLAKDIVKEGQ